MMQKSEELRDWFNMYCSWNWYIAGNIKNLILMQDYGFVGILVNYTTGAIPLRLQTGGFLKHDQGHPDFARCGGVSRTAAEC